MGCCHCHECYSPLRITLGSQSLYGEPAGMVEVGVYALWTLNGHMVTVQLTGTGATCYVHTSSWCTLASVLCLSQPPVYPLSSLFFFLLFPLCHPAEPSVSSHVCFFEESLSPW